MAREITHEKFYNVHAFADKLAIGLRLRGADPGEVVVRALRVDLAALAP